MRVRAAEGRSVPMEHKPRERIGAKAVTVPDSTYYRRRVTAGDLVLAEPPAPTSTADDAVSSADTKPASTKRKKGSAE